MPIFYEYFHCEKLKFALKLLVHFWESLASMDHDRFWQSDRPDKESQEIWNCINKMFPKNYYTIVLVYSSFLPGESKNFESSFVSPSSSDFDQIWMITHTYVHILFVTSIISDFFFNSNSGYFTFFQYFTTGYLLYNKKIYQLCIYIILWITANIMGTISGVRKIGEPYCIKKLKLNSFHIDPTKDKKGTALKNKCSSTKLWRKSRLSDWCILHRWRMEIRNFI